MTKRTKLTIMDITAVICCCVVIAGQTTVITGMVVFLLSFYLWRPREVKE